MSALLLALLELTFVMVSIMLLHSLKRTIGSPAFYLSLGMFLVLGQIVSSAGIQIDPGVAGFRVGVGHAVLLSPYLVALLLVYILDGTLEAQRVIMGFLAILLGYFYLASLTASQCSWKGYVAEDPDSVFYLIRLFLQGRRVVAASFTAHAIDLFTLPIIYQLFRNMRLRLFFCVLATLLVAQVIDAFVFELLTSTDLSDWWSHLRGTYLARAAAMIWLSVLTTIYLRMCNVGPPRRRRPLDIVVAFFGSYGRALRLQRNVREWEGRYRVVFEQSSELIFIVAQNGAILNANHTAATVMRGKAPDLNGVKVQDLFLAADDHDVDWQTIWERLQMVPPEETTTGNIVVEREWKAVIDHEHILHLDTHVSSAELHGNRVAIAVARDVTERRQMELERQQLQEQLVHSQRLEAIGQLAGGVAHDFNNMLHTIQGSLDAFNRQKQLPERQRPLLDNIGEACKRASVLTSQLLGFARKGKYRMERLDVARIVSDTKALFEPVATKTIQLKTLIAPTPMTIRGDSTQLQQVFLNIMLNARDAIADSGKHGKIVFRAEPVAEFTPGWHYCTDDNARPEDYVCIRIKDTGPGIPEHVLKQIFDPFFTTKPVGKGTGMGLAMAYGCVLNHHGWIHVRTKMGRGTEFFIFLPAV